MISLANHLQTEQGCFALILTVIWGHFTSMKIRKNSNSFLLYQVAQFHLQIVNNYAYLRKESAPGTFGYCLVCHGAALNYLNMFNDIN